MAHSNRGDGSGIRLFRVPTGSMFMNDAGRGIEIVQARHRYLMVAPSMHPDGRPYSWFDEADDAEVEMPPEPSESPDLPWAWQAALATAKGPTALAATPEAVRAFVEAHAQRRAGRGRLTP